MPNKPLPKPKQFLDTLELLHSKAAANTLSPKTYADLVGQFAQKAYQNDELSFREYMGIVKPLFGRVGEMVTEKIRQYEDMDNYAQGGRVNFLEGGDTKYNAMVTEMYIKAGGKEGTGMDIDTFAKEYFKKFSTGGRVKYSNGSDEPDISKLKEKIIELMDDENLTFEEAYREAREEGYAVGGRVGFDEGTPKDFNRNPSGKNQYTPKTLNQVVAMLNDPKYSDFRKTDFVKNKLIGKKTLNKYEKLYPNLIKYPAYGKRSNPEKTRGEQNLKASKFYKSTQGGAISMDKINNFAHYAPKLLSYLTSTADTGPLKAEVNRAAEGYDKKALSIAEKQEKLIKEKPKGWKLKLDAANAEARKASIEANKTLPNKLKGTLGYFVVSPTGEFKLKGVDRAKTFAGISGEKQEYKKMDPSQRAAFGPTQSKVQGVIDLIKSKFPNVKTTRASNLPLPPKTVTANMFKTAFKGAPGPGGDIKDPLGGPDLINVKKYNKNPYDDVF